MSRDGEKNNCCLFGNNNVADVLEEIINPAKRYVFSDSGTETTLILEKHLSCESLKDDQLMALENRKTKRINESKQVLEKSGIPCSCGDQTIREIALENLSLKTENENLKKIIAEKDDLIKKLTVHKEKQAMALSAISEGMSNMEMLYEGFLFKNNLNDDRFENRSDNL